MDHAHSGVRLCEAVCSNNISLVHDMLRKGRSDPNSRDYDGNTPLHIAAEDPYCPKDAQVAIGQALGNHPGVEIQTYPSCTHAFASPQRSSS